jgi:hypothetical protein
MSVFFAAQTWPFMLATILLLLITLIEGAALLAGNTASSWLDSLLPDPWDSVHGPFDHWLGWLHVGRVPILVLIVIFLAAFSVTGFALNMVVRGLTGVYVTPLLGVPLAFVCALPVVRILGAGIAKVVPKDETFAVTLDTLVGRVATIMGGTARKGYPAQAKVADQHGRTLYVMVEPEAGAPDLDAGTSVLIVRQLNGSRFSGIPNPRPDLL